MQAKLSYPFIILLSLFRVVTVFAQSGIIQNIGVPSVQNYSKSSYKAGNQNWSLVGGQNGIMYFGNAAGLLSFNGSKWQLYHMPNRIEVRVVATDTTGKIYTGGFGEFGYWDYNKEGKFVYHSLVNLMPEAQRPTDEIWKIYPDGERVLFQSFSSIFIYEKGKIDVVRGESSFLFLLKAGDRFFVEVLSKGLYELKGASLTQIENSNSIGIAGVLSVLPYKEDRYLIGTAKNGLFLYDGKNVKPWTNDGDDFLKTYQLNNGSLIWGKYYAFGTILNGIIILDEAGNVVQQINRSNGLQNNTVLSLYVDREHNLWAGLDNGIDRIDLNSPLYFHSDKAGKIGTVYSSIIHENKIYLGTNQGLFYSDWSGGDERSFQSFDFKLIPNSQGQVWDLSLIDNQLLCGHNEGTYRVEGARLHTISEVNGGWTIKKLPSNPDLLIQGTYTGLAIYKKDESGHWVYSHKVANYGEPSTYVEQDVSGNIWVSHIYKGLFKLKLDKGLLTVKESKKYGKEDGLPVSHNINIFRFNNRIVFSTNSGFYIYDEIGDKFLPYDQLNNKLGSFASSNQIIETANRHYWFIQDGKVALANMKEPGKLVLDETQFDVLNGHMVQSCESISQISSSTYLINIDDGFVIYNAEPGGKQPAKLIPLVLITSIENTTDSTTVISENGSAGRAIRIPFEENNIRINYALPYYSQANIQFQYFLEGYSNSWSEWTSDVQKEFTNLGQGDYRFLIRASVNGVRVSETAVFEFTVLPPWYATNWAIFVYFLIGIITFVLVRRIYILKLQRDKEQIQQKLEQEKEEYLRQKRIETEQKLVKLKNEQLQADLTRKSRELSNSALSILAKNELLQTIKHEVVQLNELTSKSLPKEQYKKIEKIIEGGMHDAQDWYLFENSFNEAHENYFKKLIAEHPELTPNDLKLSAYLRMNMNSKEIASLLNITVRGVELRRYRLRKRLNLERETNLTEYLLKL